MLFRWKISYFCAILLPYGKRREGRAVKRLVRKHFLWFYEKMDKDAIDAYAAQASFWILIAFIPFLMFLLTLSQLIRFEDTTLRT